MQFDDGAIQPSPPLKAVFKINSRDILAELLADKRSENTRRAYRKDLRDFFVHIAEQEPSPQLVEEFLKLERFTAIGLVLGYKAALVERGLAEATVNRRLAAIKSLVRYAQKIGRCQWSLEEVEGERIKSYRDTTGVDVAVYQKILQTCDRSTPIGRRDYVILRLLWDNVLRRSELAQASVEDLNLEAKTLKILGKGRGTQKEAVSLSAPTVAAIAEMLGDRAGLKPGDPLFVSLARGSQGKRLSTESIYQVVRQRAEQVGTGKRLSPHRIRHSGITAALDATNGNVREVRKLSRHAKIETLLVYDDNRINHQQGLTELLSNLLDAS